MKTDLYWTHL